MNRTRIKRLLKILYYLLLCWVLAPRDKGLDPYKDTPLKHWITRKVPGRHNSAVLLIITGKVAGVGYRNWLRLRARARGIEYLVRQRNKRTVVALLVGSPIEIEALVRTTWRGPVRSRVEKVREYWFNKPVKVKAGDGKAVEVVAWSRGTAELIRRTLEQLQHITQLPNKYAETDRVSGTDELIKAARKRNLFYLRCLRKELYLASPIREIGFQRTKTTRVSSMIHSLTDQKHLAKMFLSCYGVPVPKGDLFTDLDRAKEYLARSNHPLVVKPAVGLNGSGVTVDIRTEGALEAAWNYALQFHDTIVMEELVEGVDIRVILIGGKAKAAYIRVPANVVGDGISTVEQLIDKKNKLRLKHPHLSKNLIVPDDYSDSYLSRQGYTFDRVPPANEIVFIHLKANISRGGDSINITDLIHPDLMKLAEEAAEAFGKVDYWGIDLLVESIDRPRDEQKCVVIELNSTANIEGVNYPFYGRRVNAAEAFIDYLFTEDTGDCSYPTGTVKVEITGYLPPTFTEEICKLAGEFNIDGSIKVKDSAAEVTAAGRQHHLLSFLEVIWDWRRNDYLVDGLRVCPVNENVAEGFIAESGAPITPLLHERARSELFLKPVDTNRYNLDQNDHANSISLNTQLFINEFKHRDYEAVHLYKELLEVRREGATGVTGMHHSSLFCDQICDRRYPAKKLLALKGMPVLRGAHFRCSRRRRALEYFKHLPKPCIVTRLLPGQYETHLVNSAEELKYVWKQARKIGTRNMFIEEYFNSWHVLVAVVAGKAVDALVAEPLSVCGDGVSTIKQLIAKINRERSQNPWYRENLVADEGHLKRRLKLADMQLDTVLGKGENILLESVVGLEYGGETINVNELLHADFKKKAVQAVSAIPGLEYAVVQMLIPQPEKQAEGQHWAIYRVETKPDAAMFHFPGKGTPQALVGEVVSKLCLTDRIKWMKKGEAEDET